MIINTPLKKTLKIRILTNFAAYILLFLSPAFLTSIKAAYRDVPSTHPYIEGISYIELQGASDNADKFRPDDIITKAEAFKLLFEVLDLKKEKLQKDPFEDVSMDTWFAPYAKLALDNDLISKDQKKFNPSRQMRRMDAILLMMQAYGLDVPIIPNEAPSVALDVNEDSPVYPWLYQLLRMKIIESNLQSTFNPYAPITRGEFAQWIYTFEVWLQNFELEKYTEEKSDFYKNDIIESVWYNIINYAYLDETSYIDEDALFQAAIKGMVESLNDPYSKYFTPEEANSFTETISGEFEGIGAVIGSNDAGNIVVQGILKDGPAEMSGLKKNDIIKAVDGINVEGMNVQDVISRIKGPKGTNVTLSIIRNEQSLLIEITRAYIEVVLVSGNIKWRDVWYIDIDSFSSTLPSELMELIFTLEEKVDEPSAIVLDLRGNPGGSLKSAAFTIGLFVPRLTQSLQLDYGGYTEIIYNGDWGPYKDIPLTIIIDEESASASEIVALTLQENGATILGRQSFGKGTAQNYITYWDGSALKLTIAEWLSGGGRSIQGIGVTPDIIVDEAADESRWMEILEQSL